MNILILVANNPVMVLLGLIGLVMIIAAGWLGRAPKTVRHPVRVRIPVDRRK